MSEPIRYIVLTEAPDRHHVAVSRAVPATGWVQIIATFPRLSRAQDYADIENEMTDDPSHGTEWRQDDHEAPPVVDEPESAVGHVVEMIERHRSVETTRTTSYTAASGKPRPAGALVNEILRELPVMIEEFPKGPTARIFAERLCVEEHFVRRALREIGSEGRARYMTRRDSSAHHLVPLDYVPPIEELTPSQRAIFEFMSTHADEGGVVRVPKRQIAIGAGCPTGSIQMVLDSLERKGRLVGVDKQRGTELPITYRIVKQPQLGGPDHA